MRRLTRFRKLRKGAVAPLFAILCVPLLGMAAFSVDMSHVVLTQTELQMTADSCALAAAGQLMNPFVQYYLPGQTTQNTILSTGKSSATTYAQNYAGYNRAGQMYLSLPGSDVVFGYTDASGTFTASPTYTGFPNTVKVTARRDSTANGALPLAFGPVLGTNSVGLNAVGAATIDAGSVDTFASSQSRPVRILPMTYDVNHWNNFLATGKGPDGSTDRAYNGAPQLQVYPSLKFTGNFGELSLDQNNNGASTISGWINNGVTQSDLQNEYNAHLLPLSAHNPLLWDWKGNPGLKTSTIHTLMGQIGQTYLLPLFKPLNDGSIDPALYAAGTGNGSHYYYNIVGFVGITITYVDNSGVHVQPSAFIDPNVVLKNIGVAVPPATGSSSLTTTFTTAKLTQ